MKYVDNMGISITDFLQGKRDQSIKQILNLLDMSDISRDDKKEVRKAVLSSLNEFYDASCNVLTYIQEN